MKNKNDDKKSTFFLTLGISLGVIFGITLDKLALCLGIGVAFGALLDRAQNRE